MDSQPLNLKYQRDDDSVQFWGAKLGLVDEYYFFGIRDSYEEDLNRLKVVLAEKKRTNKWLAEQLGKDPATVSKWCTNSAQPTLENLMDIARCLEVSINDLVRM